MSYLNIIIILKKNKLINDLFYIFYHIIETLKYNI